MTNPISPEQREIWLEKVGKRLSRYYETTEIDIDLANQIQADGRSMVAEIKRLLSSEQAWREKYEVMETRMKGYESQSIKNINLAEDYKEQLNQAMGVLKAARDQISELEYDPHESITWNKIDNFLSSLPQEGDSHEKR